MLGLNTFKFCRSLFVLLGMIFLALTPALAQDQSTSEKPLAECFRLDGVIGSSILLSQQSAEIFLKTSLPCKISSNSYIPKDSIVHGAATSELGRDGYYRAWFDYLITPDGRKVELLDAVNSQKFNGKLKIEKHPQKAQSVCRDSNCEKVQKALEAYYACRWKNFFPPGTVVSVTWEASPHLEPPIKPLESSIKPLETADIRLPSLDVEIKKTHYSKSPIVQGDDQLTLTLHISNKTPHTFSTFEIGLEDEYGNVFFPSPFGDTGMWFSKITPNSKTTSNITFNVDNIKQHHTLVFFKPYTREPLAKYALFDSVVVDKKQSK